MTPQGTTDRCPTCGSTGQRSCVNPDHDHSTGMLVNANGGCVFCSDGWHRRDTPQGTTDPEDVMRSERDAWRREFETQRDNSNRLAAEVASLRAENLELREALAKIEAGSRQGHTYADLLDIAYAALRPNPEGETVKRGDPDLPHGEEF